MFISARLKGALRTSSRLPGRSGALPRRDGAAGDFGSRVVKSGLRLEVRGSLDLNFGTQPGTVLDSSCERPWETFAWAFARGGGLMEYCLAANTPLKACPPRCLTVIPRPSHTRCFRTASPVEMEKKVWK